MSAAYRNSRGQYRKQLTDYYEELCDHYRLEPTRNNKGIAHENGAIVRFVPTRKAERLIR